MQNLYSFILGRSPELSFAEIKSVLNFKNIDFKIVNLNNQFLIIEAKPASHSLRHQALATAMRHRVAGGQELDIKNLNKTLGGIVKIGKIDFFIDGLDNIENIKNTLLHYIEKNCNLDSPLIPPSQDLVPLRTGKVQFGFSLYSKNKDLRFFIRTLSKTLKEDLKEKEINSRIVTSRKDSLSAVIVKKEHLLDNGVDWQVFKVNSRIYFSRTLSVQDFELFNALDYDRPRADSKSGMMPPKLAKIMLNLTQSKGVVLDPFCGSSTVLLMAAELGFKKIIGSDISQKAVENSLENLKWYKERFNKNINFYIFKSNVRSLVIEGIEKSSIDCIVSEGYLGEPLRGDETLGFIKKQIKELEDLYFESFIVFHKILKPNASVVISLPFFNLHKGSFYLDIIEKIESIGFKKVNLLNKEYLNKRGGIIYKRKGQRVLREIIRFIKN